MTTRSALLCFAFAFAVMLAFPCRAIARTPSTSSTASSEGSARIVVLGLMPSSRLRQKLEVELVALGFGVTFEPRPSPPIELAQRARQLSAAAAIQVDANDGAALSVWIFDRMTGKLLHRKLTDVNSEHDPRVAALRVVELLRASLRELDDGSEPPPEAEVQPAPALHPRVARRPWLGVLAGPNVLAGGADLPALPMLGVHVSLRFPLGWGVGASAIVPLASAEVAAPEGFAEVSPYVMSAWFGYYLRLARTELGFDIGGGAVLVRMLGTAHAPYQSGRDVAASPVALARFTVEHELGGMALIAANVFAGSVVPPIQVHFARRAVAEYGLPLAGGGVHIGFKFR